jgi:hypothetical protein
MCHLSVALNCFKFFITDYIIGQREYIIQFMKVKVSVFELYRYSQTYT